MREVNLSHELDLIRAAVGATKALLGLLRDVPMRLHHLPVGFVSSLTAGLTLVETRLRNLDRVVRGTSDPEQLWIPETSNEGESDPEDDDVIFGWSEKRRMKHHRVEMKRAKRRRRHQRRQRKLET